MTKFYLPLLFTMATTPLLAQIPVINSVTPLMTVVEQWGKFEVAVSLTATYSNPYDYDDIRVYAEFTGPDGAVTTADGFFNQEYQITNAATGAITPVGNGGFKVRFAPKTTGTWSYKVYCTTAGGTGNSAVQSFTAVTPSAGNKGFVRSDQTNYLYFDEGSSYVPIGENIAWQQSNVIPDYQKWLSKMADNGGNYFRLWQCHWGLGLEWKNNVSNYSGLKKYKQSNAFLTDWLLDLCADKGIYVMYCLQHHGQVSSTTNPNWYESPYNAANGGPCANTWDFFTNATAKSLVKNRFRYCVARWGYSRNVLCWELFNEVEWTDNFEDNKSEITDWHNEMGAYLKNIDPYNRLVTTSYAHDYNDPATWNLPDIDFTQTHYYVSTPNLERVLRAGVQNYLQQFGKPSMNGEFGLNPASGNLAGLDPDGIHIHNCLWGSFFGGGLGTGMSWWWESYIEPQNLYTHFQGLSAVAGQFDPHGGDFAPAAATALGTPVDLQIGTSGGWSELADTLFEIDAQGNIFPMGASPGVFLYGSSWNTQYRRPPVFDFTIMQAGQFKVKTGSETGQNPKIAIWVDGVKKLEQSAAVNQTYTVDIPAGAHTVKVDNTGTDWITISSYSIPGAGSSVDGYVLQSADHQKVAAWVLNNRYNHDYIKSNGLPPAVSDASLSVPGMTNGNYVARFFDGLTGAQLSSTEVNVNNGTLSLQLPAFQWDMGVLVETAPVGIKVPLVATKQHFDFKAMPNPAVAGQSVRLAFNLESAQKVQFEMADASGRVLNNLGTYTAQDGENVIECQVPASLPGGVYWVKGSGAGMIGAAVMVVR